EVQSLIPGRDKEAIDALRQCIELDPRAILAYKRLADIRLRRNEVDEAIRQLQFLLEKSPGYRPARIQLAEVYRTAGPAYAQAYITFLAESAKLFPGDAYWPVHLARMLKQ